MGFNSLIGRDSFILQCLSDRPFASISKWSHFKLWPVDVTWTWCDVVSNSRRMKAACDCSKMFRFSVMQSLFSFSNIEILAVPTASLIQNFLLTVGNGWFYLCREIETWCALKSNPKVNAAITFIKAGFRGTKQNCYQTTPPKELGFKKEYLILFFSSWWSSKQNSRKRTLKPNIMRKEVSFSKTQ